MKSSKSALGVVAIIGLGAFFAHAYIRSQQAKAAAAQQLPVYAYRYFRNDLPLSQRSINPTQAVYL